MSVMDRFSLKGKVSVVTGAATGLGKTMAAALAQAGSDIVIADVNVAQAEKTAGEIKKENTEVLVVGMDVTREDDVFHMVETVTGKFGRIDVLINNAGIAVQEKAEDMSLEVWRKVTGVNLDGVFLVSREVGKVMIRQKAGSIINISSMSGIISNTPQCQCSYNASKAGVIMLTKSLAGEWAKHNIKVNTIAPGYMKTKLTKRFFEEGGDIIKKWMGMSPMGRPGEPHELEGIAVYLASDASSFATGGVFVIDGGYTVW
jgi:NAD(P)-dependent dehydrogenase (short-subunit alcohol dehydrogenase family)